ncbi:hypothetical protein ACODYM_29235 [Burkholderia gladioli]|uniref:hypothetical protein n=1 Tax=Burkholderia gladioli TaxID=28095 RepID=UPI003B50D945
MKLQLLEVGYTSYTGRLGTIQFAGGISVNDVDPNAAAGLAALFKMQWTDAAAEPTVAPIDMTDPTNQFLGNGVDVASAQVAAGLGQTSAQVVSAGAAANVASSDSNVTTYSAKFYDQTQASVQTGAAYVQPAGTGNQTVDVSGVHAAS